MNTAAPSAKPLPPGPRRPFLVASLIRLGGDPLARFTSLAREYGDILMFRAMGERIIFLNHPDHIREVLVTQSKRFAKGRALERARSVLGKGLLTSEGSLHLRQRRLIQPAFHEQRIAAFAGIMTAHAERMTANWRDGETRDVAGEMMRLTLGIVGQTLLGADVGGDAARVRDAFNTVMHSFPLLMLPWSDLLQKLPIPAMKRLRTARADLDRIVNDLIAARRADGTDHGDLLSMLLAAHDPESSDPESGMTDEQVRDELMTIFLAGHETTANALAWTWHLLAKHPAAEAKLHAELRKALPDGRMPTLADMPALAFTEQVVHESLRLYPPAWLIGRRALEACEIGGYRVPARAMVIASQWVTHRDPRWFPNPESFDPERWTPEFKATLPKYAFFPFGGGPRRCVGEGFAWLELVLLIAAIARRWRFEDASAAPIVPEPLITLRPKGGMPMRLRLLDTHAIWSGRL